MTHDIPLIRSWVNEVEGGWFETAGGGRLGSASNLLAASAGQISQPELAIAKTYRGQKLLCAGLIMKDSFRCEALPENELQTLGVKVMKMLLVPIKRI